MDLIKALVDTLNEHQQWTREIEIPRNAFLKQANTIDHNLYYITEGCIRVYLIKNGEEMTIRFGYAGSIIAALDSFIHENSSNLMMQALRKTKLKLIPKPNFIQFMRADKDRLNLWIDILSNFVLQQMEREEDILTDDPRERFQRVMQRSPHLFQEVPHKYIASYLRMTPETLSRIKKS